MLTGGDNSCAQSRPARVVAVVAVVVPGVVSATVQCPQLFWHPLSIDGTEPQEASAKAIWQKDTVFLHTRAGRAAMVAEVVVAAILV